MIDKNRRRNISRTLSRTLKLCWARTQTSHFSWLALMVCATAIPLAIPLAIPFMQLRWWQCLMSSRSSQISWKVPNCQKDAARNPSASWRSNCEMSLRLTITTTSSVSRLVVKHQQLQVKMAVLVDFLLLLLLLLLWPPSQCAKFGDCEPSVCFGW